VQYKVTEIFNKDCRNPEKSKPSPDTNVCRKIFMMIFDCHNFIAVNDRPHYDIDYDHGELEGEIGFAYEDAAF
jgi:hypothetical protein